jgi:hypothetical protein
MAHMPFPSNENTTIAPSLQPGGQKSPWKRSSPGEPPPLMLQFVFYDGRVISYACADIREMRKRDAGHIELSIYGMEKYRVSIQGRNLNELFELLQIGRIKSMTELGPRNFELPEESPSIDQINIESLTGPPA